jgi:hypothetical protein
MKIDWSNWTGIFETCFLAFIPIAGISWVGYDHGGGWAGVFGAWELIFALIGIGAVFELIKGEIRRQRTMKEPPV